MVTALLLYHANDMLNDGSQKINIKKHRYNDQNGPYQVSSISYATDLELKNFQANLKKLPDHEHKKFLFENI